MPRKHRQYVQALFFEQVDHIVIPQIDDPQQFPLRDQRRAHHGAQLQAHHALAGLEVRVVERVADDQGSARCHDALEDAVRQVAAVVRQALAVEVAGHSDARRLLAYEHQETLVRVGHLDDRVHQCFQQLVHGLEIHQALAELIELAQAAQLRGGLAARIGLRFVI